MAILNSLIQPGGVQENGAVLYSQVYTQHIIINVTRHTEYKKQ